MEHALIFASIIVGVAISDQIVSLHRLLRGGVPVKWHWAQPWFALLVLLLNVMMWWAIVGVREETLTIGQFLPTIVQLILLALLTITSLPDRVAAEGVDLADYYQRNRRYQWLLLALTLGWSMLSDVAEHLRNGVTGAEAFGRESEDSLILAIMVGLAFARRWWLVAVGMAMLSMGPLQWLSRSVG